MAFDCSGLIICLIFRWPFVVIATCAVVTGLAAVGFLKFRWESTIKYNIYFYVFIILSCTDPNYISLVSQENRADRLWIPESSDYNTHQVENKIQFLKKLRLRVNIYTLRDGLMKTLRRMKGVKLSFSNPTTF